MAIGVSLSSANRAAKSVIAVPPIPRRAREAGDCRSGVVRVDARRPSAPARSPSSQSGWPNRATNQNRHASGRRPAVACKNRAGAGRDYPPVSLERALLSPKSLPRTLSSRRSSTL